MPLERDEYGWAAYDDVPDALLEYLGSILRDFAPTVEGLGGGVEKVKRYGNRGSVRSKGLWDPRVLRKNLNGARQGRRTACRTSESSHSVQE